jgi:hypothetical protein
MKCARPGTNEYTNEPIERHIRQYEWRTAIVIDKSQRSGKGTARIQNRWLILPFFVVPFDISRFAVTIDAVGVAVTIDAVGVAITIDAVGVAITIDAVGVAVSIDAVGVAVTIKQFE